MFRLPDGWSRPKAFDDIVVAGGIRIRRSGVASRAPSGEEIVGAAAARFSPTRDRAWFELAERVSIIDALSRRTRLLPTFDAQGERVGEVARGDAFPRSAAPRRWTYARSNGVAIHVDWPTACTRARWELGERDRVLRSWLGDVTPRAIALTDPTLVGSRRYEFVAIDLAADADSFAPDLAVAGVVGFPRRAGDPLALGFAARPALSDALEAATSEALQLLAFLWGESPPEEIASGPPSPAVHLDTYQALSGRPRIRRWLEGEHRVYASRTRSTPSNHRGIARVDYIDLSRPWLGAGLKVAKAISDAALPFGFGELPITAHLPSELRIHPIP